MELTPLIAAKRADLDTFKTIYETGHLYTNPADPGFFSYAVQNPNPTARRKIFDYLLTLGLDPNETTRRYGTPADILIGQYRYTDTQLLPYIQLLLDHGFDPTQPGRDGYTALQYSKKTDGSRDHIHTLLLNHARGT